MRAEVRMPVKAYHLVWLLQTFRRLQCFYGFVIEKFPFSKKTQNKTSNVFKLSNIFKTPNEDCKTFFQTLQHKLHE